MATHVKARRTANRRPSPINAIVRDFRQYLVLKREAEDIGRRYEELKDRLRDAVGEEGQVDDRKNSWLKLPEPVEYTDSRGRRFQYTALKRERHLRPSQPAPDPDLAEELLRKKKLWLKPEQERAIRDLQTACPFVTISVDVDPGEVEKLYLTGRITEKEFLDVLMEQKASFHFVSVETD